MPIGAPNTTKLVKGRAKARLMREPNSDEARDVYENATRDHAAAVIAASIQRQLDAAPPLRPSQIDELTALLRHGLIEPVAEFGRRLDAVRDEIEEARR